MTVPSILPQSMSDGLELKTIDNSISRGAATRFSVNAISTEEGLSSLEEDWNRLGETAESPNVFTTFDWFRAWNRHRSHETRRSLRRPNVLVLKKDGAIAGISPLIYRETSRFGMAVRKMEFVGREADYNDLVLGNNAAAQSVAIAEFLAETHDHWDLVDLRDLRGTGETIAQIESALSNAGLIYRSLPEEERCPFLPIDAPSSEIVSSRSRSIRRMADGLHTLRKKQHRLERMSAGGLRVRIIENPQSEQGLLQKLIALENQKHVHGELSPPFISVYPEVFQSLFDSLGPRGWIYIAMMEMGDQPIGWRLGFRCGKKLWDFLTAYNHAYSRLSPGTMLVNAVLDYGYSHGYTEHDFLRGEESYKMQWSTGFHQTYRLLIWNRRWISQARALMYLDLKRVIYRVFGRTS